MRDWNDATGMQLAMVKDALLSAYPNPVDFDVFLLLRLDRRYEQIAGVGVNYGNGLVQVLIQAKAQGWLNDLVIAAQSDVPGNRNLKALRMLRDLTAATPPAGRILEDIVRQDAGFADVIPWIRRLDTLTAQICRIESPINQGVGTGWLVANDLLLTNWHVVAPILENKKKPSDYVCRFDYATDATGTNAGVTFSLAQDWCLSSSPASSLELGTGRNGPTGNELDYALVRLAKPVGDGHGPLGQKRKWIATTRGTAAPKAGNVVFLLQHPSGDPQKLAIGTALGPNANATRIRHDANTQTGSSGSPCLNAKLELIGLHNSGDPLYNGITGAPKENHAVPIDAILAKLESAGAPKFWN